MDSSLKLNQHKINADVILFAGICIYLALLPIMQNPYNPVFGSPLTTGRVQLTDIILALISPLGLYIIIKDRGKELRKYLIIILAIAAYLLSYVFASDFELSLSRNFEIISALMLSWLFILILQSIKNTLRVKLALYSALAGVIFVLAVSYVALLVYYIFGVKIGYILQENHVFPYIGDVTRVIGPLQPTSKLLSSYFTLVIGILVGSFFIEKNKKIRIALIVIIAMAIALYPFTLSRGIVGFVLAITITFYFVARNKGFNQILPFCGVLAGILIFFITLLASSIYVKDASYKYSYDNKPDQIHSVYYYYHPDRGKENIAINLTFARDHYYWLKKSALEIFLKTPSGAGNGKYSEKTRELENKGVIPKGLSRHPTPQSEFLYAAAERGWFGLAAIVILFMSWIFVITKPLLNKKNIDTRLKLMLTGAAVSLSCLCFIDTLHLEISRFRFLWAFAALFIVLSTHGVFSAEENSSDTS